MAAGRRDDARAGAGGDDQSPWWGRTAGHRAKSAVKSFVLADQRRVAEELGADAHPVHEAIGEAGAPGQLVADVERDARVGELRRRSNGSTMPVSLRRIAPMLTATVIGPRVKSAISLGWKVNVLPTWLTTLWKLDSNN